MSFSSARLSHATSVATPIPHVIVSDVATAINFYHRAFYAATRIVLRVPPPSPADLPSAADATATTVGGDDDSDAASTSDREKVRAAREPSRQNLVAQLTDRVVHAEVMIPWRQQHARTLPPASSQLASDGTGWTSLALSESLNADLLVAAAAPIGSISPTPPATGTSTGRLSRGGSMTALPMPFPPPTFRLNLIVDDVVTAYLRAVRAGAIPVQRPSYSNDDPFLTYIQSSMTLSAAAGGSQQLSSAAKGVPSTTLAYSIGADKVNVADDDSAPPPTDSTHQQQLSFRITAIIRDPCGIEWVLIGAVAADSATPLPPVALGIGATTASATLSEGVAEATRDDDVGAGVETGADAGVTNRIDALQHAHTAQWRNIYWPMLFAALDAATAVGHCTPLAMPAASADAAVVAESTAQPATSAEKPKRKAAATGAATKKREEKASETAKKETQNATPRTPAPSAAEKLSPGVHAEARPSAVSSSSSAVAVAALKAMSQSKSAVVAGKRATPVPSKRLPEKEKIGAAIAVSTESPSASPAGGTVARAAAAAVQGSATPTPSTASAAAVVLLSTPTAAGIGDAANGVATPVPVLPSSVPKVPPKIAVRRSAPPSPAVPDLAKPFL